MVGMVLQNGDASLKMLAWSGSMNGFQSTNMIQFLVWNWHPTFWVSAKYSEIRQKVLLMAQILYPVEQESLIPFLKQAFFLKPLWWCNEADFFSGEDEKIDHISCSKIPKKLWKHGIWRWTFASESRCQAKKLHPAESGAWVVSLWLLLMVRLLHLDPFDWWLPPRVSTAEFFQF